jgi:large subunit ribosomal protein L29
MIKELRQKSIDELKNIVFEKREKLRQLRFDLAAGKVKNVREIRKIRRDIARILTVLKEKSLDNNNLAKRVKK